MERVAVRSIPRGFRATRKRPETTIGAHGGADQLLHGEPHPGNVLTTKNGLVFIDLETVLPWTCRIRSRPCARKKSAGIIRVLIVTCCASVGSSC